MTNEQILKKSIEKAVKGGYKRLKGIELDPHIQNWDVIVGCIFNKIIFSHDFAKAYWGEKKLCYDRFRIILAWQYHQHKMLDELQAGRSPIKYLEKFL